MADGKWIPGLRADQPADEAARVVLEARLGVVREYLPRALAHPDDVENVHQLRVGTRRADAAVRIFGQCLPAKMFKSVRRRLRELRRAAGAARDWDVFALALARRRKRCHAAHRPGLDHLLGYALARRDIAQNELEKAGHRELDRITATATDTVAAVGHEPPVPTLLALARATLGALRDELHGAASAHLEDYDRLHEVRIAGKRLRYAMELFADCFPPPFRFRLYPRVEEMQETLGRANDSHVAVGRLAEVRDRTQALWPDEWERLGAGIDGLARYHQRRLPRERKEFLKWWETWRAEGAPALEEMLNGSGLVGINRQDAKSAKEDAGGNMPIVTP